MRNSKLLKPDKYGEKCFRYILKSSKYLTFTPGSKTPNGQVRN